MEQLVVLDSLDGYQFQDLIAKLMRKRGYKQIKIRKSRDMGKDIVMKGPNNEIFLIECKHQSLVGRPVVQKLQGAMDHEKRIHKENNIRGIIVTSGTFSKDALEYIDEISQDIELVDGKKLRNLCEELNIDTLNGKVQLINNDSFINISKTASENLSLKNYSKIYWSKSCKPHIITGLKFCPVACVKYHVNFDTRTSVGKIDSYSKTGIVSIEGDKCTKLDDNIEDFFFSNKIVKEPINSIQGEKIPFRYTENDIEEKALNLITEEGTHEVSYTGNNNVTYTKECIPKRKDIDIQEITPIHLPFWINEINILKMTYYQKFFVKGDKQLFIKNDLKKCTICDDRKENDYENMSICPECARIVCESHRKLDYLDKKTPICNLHVKPFKLFLQNKYFASNENRILYKKWWAKLGLMPKLREDKIVSTLILVVLGITSLTFVALSI